MPIALLFLALAATAIGLFAVLVPYTLLTEMPLVVQIGGFRYFAALIGMPALLCTYLAVFIHAILAWRYRPGTEFFRECRCRQCASVLANLTEPRCPHCGEPL
jgi:hypothetical protein